MDMRCYNYTCKKYDKQEKTRKDCPKTMNCKYRINDNDISKAVEGAFEEFHTDAVDDPERPEGDGTGPVDYPRNVVKKRIVFREGE